MISHLISAARQLNRYWFQALIAGLAFVALKNWWDWQGDRFRLVKGESTPPETPLYDWDTHPKVSVLVAAWNESRHIDDHIRSFLALDYPSIELVLCAGGTDDTLSRARSYAGPRVTVIEQQPGEGKQRALAKCYQHASGEILYLTDADCLYHDEAMSRILAPLAVEGEQVATGPSRPIDSQFRKLLPYHLWVAEVASEVRNGPYVNGLLGRNAVLTRNSIDRIGGLDFVAHTGTDYHLAKKLLASDIPIRYVRSSVVISEYPDTVREYRNKQSRWLRNLILHSGRYGADADRAVAMRTVLTGAVMTLLPLLALIFGRLVLVPWLVLTAQATVSRIRYMIFASRSANRPIPRLYPVALVFITAMDFVVWALPALDLLHSGRRERW